jgi:hypothetical protein
VRADRLDYLLDQHWDPPGGSLPPAGPSLGGPGLGRFGFGNLRGTVRRVFVYRRLKPVLKPSRNHEPRELTSASEGIDSGSMSPLPVGRFGPVNINRSIVRVVGVGSVVFSGLLLI